jgi:hypothetical protein
MTEVRAAFADRLARLLSLKPNKGHREEIKLHDGGSITIVISPELSPSQRRQYHMLTSTRAIQIEGVFQQSGIKYYFVARDLNGDGEISDDDECGVVDDYSGDDIVVISAKTFVGGDLNFKPQDLYQVITKLVEDYYTLRQNKKP